jgi:DNA polymerase III alpha subunit
MHNDIYGRQVLTENDLCDAYLKNPDIRIQNALVDSDITISDIIELDSAPTLIKHIPPLVSAEQFDTESQDNWYMPNEYQTMDIAQWVLSQCKEDYELQRVGEELILYQEKDLFPLLCYCKYLVDTMRKHNIVWGVGRGSSVSSYVLYLIGIHRINSLHYDLSIDEFLK